jgi:hypothetical protein
MTPEDWQRLWQADMARGSHPSLADLHARAEQLKGQWKYLRWFYFIGPTFLFIGSLHVLEWTRTGATLTITRAVLHMVFGLGFIVHAWIWTRRTGRLPPVTSVVASYRQALETERARLRHGSMFGIVGAANFFVTFLAMTSTSPSLATRVAMGGVGVVLMSLVAWLGFDHLRKQLAELRRLPDDPPA